MLRECVMLSVMLGVGVIKVDVTVCWSDGLRWAHVHLLFFLF